MMSAFRLRARRSRCRSWRSIPLSSSDLPGRSSLKSGLSADGSRHRLDRLRQHCRNGRPPAAPRAGAGRVSPACPGRSSPACSLQRSPATPQPGASARGSASSFDRRCSTPWSAPVCSAWRCGRLSRTLPANASKLGRRDAFLSTLIAFFIAEIGDQTQMPLWHAPPAMPIWRRWWRARPSACWRRTRLGVVSIRALLR
jgi:hypothetical protein